MCVLIRPAPFKGEWTKLKFSVCDSAHRNRQVQDVKHFCV